MPATNRNYKRTAGLSEDATGPKGRGGHGLPSPVDLRWCAWGFLMAAKLFEQNEPPTREYLEALAAMHTLKVPAMATALVNHEGPLRGPDGQVLADSNSNNDN